VTRKTAAQYMRDHKDDFIAFLPSVGGEDTAGATDDGMMTDEGFSKYCRMVAETGEWGGEPEVSHFILPGWRSESRGDEEILADSPDPSIIKSIQSPHPRHSEGSTNDCLAWRFG
jgi:hypothetical protein